MNRRILSAVLCIFLASVSIFGCGKTQGQKDKKVIATINGEPIYVEEFNRSLALNLRRDPQFKVTPQTFKNQLDIIIDKRLLIQEAKKGNLDQADRFVNTIKAFWEQTLIRDLMIQKDKELEGSVSVSQQETQDYYDKLSYRISCKIARSEDADSINRLAEGDPDSIEWDEEIGPIGFEDASSPVAFLAFDLREGEKKVIKNKNFYYLVYVNKKESVPVAPIDQIRPDIERKIKNLKKKHLFNLWLEHVRKKADVRINNGILRELK